MLKISEAGRVSDAGKLLMPMDRINEFFRQHKGKRVVARFEVSEPGSTEAQQAYYYNYVVPCVVEALRRQGTRLAEAATDAFLLSLYPCDPLTKDGEPIERAAQMDKSQMSDYLEWLIEFAAENFEVHIDDPV